MPETVSAVEEAYGKVEAEEEVEVIAPPTKRLFEMYPPPWTERSELGVEVPMPRLPLFRMVMRLVTPDPPKNPKARIVASGVVEARFATKSCSI